MESFAFYDIPLGLVKIGCGEGSICSLRRVPFPDAPHCPTPLSDRAALQLLEYCSGRRERFDLPLAPRGTPFQRTVWDALLTIPFGKTRSYGDIAAAIGKPGASRAVGMACGRNPVWIVIPCHRVVGAGQKLTGYAGGLDMKQMLLSMEKSSL